MNHLNHEQKGLIETLAEDLPSFTMDDLPDILPELMRQVNLYKTLDVQQKKTMIIKMVEHLIDITDGPGDDAIWDPILKKLLPGMLDMITDTKNNSLVLKRPKRHYFNMCC